MGAALPERKKRDGDALVSSQDSRTPMLHIEKKDRVGIWIRYNGYTHKAVALRGEARDSTGVHIFLDQLPKGFHAEHGEHQIDYIFKTHCLVADPSGEDGWIATEQVDLDFFGWSRSSRIVTGDPIDSLPF